MSTARDLRIGGTYGLDTTTGERASIKALHELCAQMPTPHVHVVTTARHHCLSFTQGVK